MSDIGWPRFAPFPSAKIQVRLRLKKSSLLRGYRTFAQILSQGRALNAGSLRCSYILVPSRRGAPLQAGFAVSKGIRRAVDRNRIKRLLREAYRKNKLPLEEKFQQSPSTLRIVFLFKHLPSTMEKRVQYTEVERSMKLLIRRLLEV